MSFVAKSIELGYQGEKYDIPITMGLINKIESSGVNVLQLAIDLDSGSMPPTSLISTMYAVMLQSVGAAVTVEQVWVEINQGDTVGIVNGARSVLYAFFPQVDTTGKDVKKTKKAGK